MRIIDDPHGVSPYDEPDRQPNCINEQPFLVFSIEFRFHHPIVDCIRILVIQTLMLEDILGTRLP